MFLQDGKFCGITLMQADMQSILLTEYIVEVTKSLKKRFPLEHAGIIASTPFSTSHYPDADGVLKNYGQEAHSRSIEFNLMSFKWFVHI